jgi:hypothetical protein
MRIALITIGLLATGCSFPICPGCKVNINDASVTLNVCVVIEYPDGALTSCKEDAGLSRD